MSDVEQIHEAPNGDIWTFRQCEECGGIAIEMRFPHTKPWSECDREICIPPSAVPSLWAVASMLPSTSPDENEDDDG